MRQVGLKSAFVLCLSFWSCSNHKTFVPERLEHPQDPWTLETNDMTQAVFDHIIDSVVSLYRPEIASQGANLTIDRYWDSTLVNAKAIKVGSDWKLIFFGGLARRSEMTPDSFAIAVCHEVGHLVGGRPYFPLSTTANEGQADYWATLQCMKRVFDPAGRFPRQLQEIPEIPGIVETMCRDEAALSEAVTASGALGTLPALTPSMCTRMLRASQAVGTLFAHLDADLEPSFLTPDRVQVSQTRHSHPEAQCRLDTYFNGVFATDRPRCWYQPEEKSDSSDDGGVILSLIPGLH